MTALRLGALLIASLAAPAGLAQMPPTAEWEITYDHAGSRMILDQWQVSGLPGSQTATPVETDLAATPYGSVQLAQHRLNFNGGGATYYPESPVVPVKLPTSVEIVLKSRVTVRWIGAGPAPASVKLKLTGNAGANYRLGEGNAEADGGVHAFDSTKLEGLEMVGGPPPTPMPYGAAHDGATRYREFPLTNGQASFFHVAAASAGGTGEWNAGASYTVVPSDWAVMIYSDRDVSFRRVVRPNEVHRVSNLKEDDGVTSRGGDGAFSTDTVVQVFWPGGSSFTTWLTALYLGPWTTGAAKSFQSEHFQFGNRIDEIRVGMPIIDTQQPGPWSIRSYASIQDTSLSLSDDAVHYTTIHNEYEKAGEPKAMFGPGYLKYCTWPIDGFAEFPVNLYRPTMLPGAHYVNDGPKEVIYVYEATNSTSSTDGWAFELSGSASFPVKFANMLFGGVWTRSGETTVTEGGRTGPTIPVPPYHRLTFWTCPYGKVLRQATAQYLSDGYAYDLDHFAIYDYSEEFRSCVRPMNKPIEEPV